MRKLVLCVSPVAKLRAIFVFILLLCSLHCLTAQSEPLTLHLFGCVPERMEIYVPQGSIYAEPVLETNSDDVSLKVYKCTYDERYTVLCVEHT